MKPLIKVFYAVTILIAISFMSCSKNESFEKEKLDLVKLSDRLSTSENFKELIQNGKNERQEFLKLMKENLGNRKLSELSSIEINTLVNKFQDNDIIKKSDATRKKLLSEIPELTSTSPTELRDLFKKSGKELVAQLHTLSIKTNSNTDSLRTVCYAECDATYYFKLDEIELSESSALLWDAWMPYWECTSYTCGEVNNNACIAACYYTYIAKCHEIFAIYDPQLQYANDDYNKCQEKCNDIM